MDQYLQKSTADEKNCKLEVLKSCVITMKRFCGTITHSFPNTLIFGQGHDGLHIFICKLSHGHALILTSDVIGHDDGGEYRESIGHVKRAVVIVVIDSSELLKIKTKL